MRTLMNLKLLVLFSAILAFVTPNVAQEKTAEEQTAYRRSSLHTILLDYGNFFKKDLVIKSYNLAPFPDKYNDHRLAETSFDPTPFMLTKEQMKQMKEQGKADAKEAKANGEKREKNGDKESNAEKKFPEVIEKYFAQNKIANQLVAKWFNRQENGAFDMSLIHERGSYDATDMEAQIAKGSIRGLATLKDAGEELIRNTFVVINKMNFVENEPIAYATKEAAKMAASQLPGIARTVAETAAETAYMATREGYSVWTTSYLYQLEWNDDIANAFYMEMWMDKETIDAAIKERFDTTSIFKLSYVGFEKAKSVVLVGIGKSPEVIIGQAAVRNIDKVYTKLQKEYDVFKTKTPIYSVKPTVAKIGLKEGVENGDKYEILEMVYNSKTGLTEYEVVGVVKVDGSNIWDNRYYMGEEDQKALEELASSDEEIVVTEETDGKKKDKEEEPEGNRDLDGTQFKGGGKKVMAGMLLRQVK